MPVDAKERLWRGVCLRQTLLRLETVFDTCEVGTSRPLGVPLTQFTPLCRARFSKVVAFAKLRAALAWELVLVQVQAPSTVVHRPDSCCVIGSGADCAICASFAKRRK